MTNAEVKINITPEQLSFAVAEDFTDTKKSSAYLGLMRSLVNNMVKGVTEGFEKTNATFSDIIKRLAIIDQAQQRITELSSSVVSLQEVLADKKSRGAFGEVQLSALIANVMPESTYSLQHTFSNGKRVDCLLMLPEPTGNIAIDAKFPLESYRLLTDNQLSDAERKLIEAQFRSDLKKHIQDIQEKFFALILIFIAVSCFILITSNVKRIIDKDK